jgi:RND family efflux transporter MFP subunit
MASPGAPLLNIEGGRLRLEAVVPESALHAVHSGATAPVRFDALAGRMLAGRVVEVAPQGDASSHTFLVKLELAAGSGARKGMFGRARFVIGERQRLMAPRQAIVEREGMSYVSVVDDAGLARLRIVTTGEPEGDRVPILSGLTAGETIVAQDAAGIADGARVREN